MSQLLVQVRRKRQEAVGIASFELVRSDGAPLPGFSAGSHVDVNLPGGLTRQYSLCNDDGGPHLYRMAVLRDTSSRGGSIAMHDAVAEGDTLSISAPRNHFPLVHARRTLLFASGIGVTPLLCMAQRLASTGADFRMHYCTRSREHTAFRDEITASSFARQVEFHHDDFADQRLDAAAVLTKPEPDVHIYVCGPKGFITHITSAARDSGWPGEQVHVEHFGADLAATPGDRAFLVQLASSGKHARCPPTRPLSRPSRPRESRSPCHANKGSAEPASRARWLASATIATCTSATPRRPGTISSRPAAHARRPRSSSWTCDDHGTPHIFSS